MGQWQLLVSAFVQPDKIHLLSLRRIRESRAVTAFTVLLFLSSISVVTAVSPPYPPSTVINKIVWAPVDTIARKATGSDNWPITWADDDAIYTTWGDGWGFEPKVPKKLSMGFARIVGTPGNYTGTNIRSPAEQLGGGRSGRKGWGIISVDGVLYLLMGHADRQGGQAQLAWSYDHARTWTFANWKFSQFGLMGFVNYGKDYKGAQDKYIYSYSHDGPLADTPADHFILMRVPKNRITKQGSWEYFERTDEAGHAVWTSNPKHRGAVFYHTDRCLRSAMTYNTPLRRYLWWQQIPAPKGSTDRGDTRFEGGFAVYDAPQPWGPWSTVFYTEHWDVGPGEHGDFPAKWMSEDGREIYLVFSGNDSLSVRKATLILAEKD
jgi:hypothetical protein